MATYEDIEDAEHLRCLALKSMVKRSMNKTSNMKSDETDDNDILLLRAAALKTITHKNKEGSLVDKDNLMKKNFKSGKRTTSNKVLKIKKKRNSYESKNNSINNNNTETKLSIEDLEYSPEIKKEVKSKFEPRTEIQIKPKTEIQIQPKNLIQSIPTVGNKIVRNGCIHLSNLDSDKYNETMVLRITFSSSESEDSSDCDSTKPNNNAAKNIRNDVLPQVTNPSTVNSCSSETDNIQSKDDRLNNLMEKLVELMQHCETEVENRDQQIKIFLEAFTKYQNYSKSVYSTLESLRKVRAELESVSSLDLKTIDS